jgi:hypothetical protein
MTDALASPFGMLPLMRSAEDILGQRIEVTLGGQGYVLPVRPRAAMRRWQASLDANFAAAIGGLASADELGDVYTALFGMSDQFLDALVAYDQTEPAFGILPDRETLDETATEVEILSATLEVWRAANPLAAMALNAMGPTIPIAVSSAPPTSSPPSTAGGRNGSRRTARKS